MANILITGMEMPKEGEVLYLAITSGGVVGRSEKALNYIPQNAKAQELPHEDLVSRSFLRGASYEIMRFPAEQAVDMYEELIENAPAVVPAS